MNRSALRILKLGIKDAERVAANEQQIKAVSSCSNLTQLSGFSFASMHDLWDAKAANRIFIDSKGHDTDLLQAFGTRREILTNQLLMAVPFIIMLGFCIAAFLLKAYVLLWGVLFCFLGFFAFHFAVLPAMVALPFIVWKVRDDWLWVCSAFYAALAFGVIVRGHFKSVIEEIALSSEVIFCDLYSKGVVWVVDRQTKQIYRKGVPA